MRPIDWDEIMVFWNKTFSVEYTMHKKMLRAAYKKFSSIKELSLKLGVSTEALRIKLRQEGIKIKKPGAGNKFGNQNWRKRKAELRKIRHNSQPI